MTSGRRRWPDLLPVDNSGLLTAWSMTRRPIAAARHAKQAPLAAGKGA